MSKLSIDELKEFLKKHFLYNKMLSDRKFSPLSIRVTGPSGVGKTSAVEQCVEELSNELKREIRWKKLNLANISDTGDLVGFPKTKTLIRRLINEDTREYEERWVWDDSLNRYKDWEMTPNSVTAYAHPEWVEYLSEGGILLLDDFNRAPVRILQAIMDIIDRRQFYSWTLPDDVLIVLTGNPSGEDYLVAEEDKAQTTRYITYNVDFDFNCWKGWAMSNGIKEEFIEFIAINHEELFSKDDKSDTNIRQWTKLFTLASITDLDDKFYGRFIDACVGNKNTHLFIEHLNEINKIEITGEEILTTSKYELMKEKLLKLIFSKNNYYRNSVASIILSRITNYLIQADKDGKKLEKPSEILVKLLSDNVFNKEAIYVLTSDLSRSASRALSILADNDNYLELVSAYKPDEKLSD